MQYDSKDLDVINKVLWFYPDVDELIAIIKCVSQADKYPLKSRPELMDVLTREEKPFGKEEEGPTAAGVRGISLLPAYYFPIASADDLIAKVVEFRGASAAPEGGGLGPFEVARSMGGPATPVGPSRGALRVAPPPEPPSPSLPLEPASMRMERPTTAE